MKALTRYLGTLLATALALGWGAARAGTLCGTVRDVQTTLPVASAGVFVRTDAGTYTGWHAATDAAGEFCIEDVDPGTYDLEIRVNDYRVQYVEDVIVSDDLLDVDIEAVAPPALTAWPQPARSMLSLRLAGWDGSAVRVFDVTGRFVRGWQPDVAVSEQTIVWDLRDHAGRRVPPGVYFVRTERSARPALRVVVSR